MEKKEILKFEADDASNTGVNGKKVFLTKRINGKVMHNKAENKNDETFEDINIEKNSNLNDEFFIEINTPLYQKNVTTNNNIKKINTKKKKIRKKQTKAQKRLKKRKKITKLVVLILIIVAVVIFALISPIFNVKTIKVTGNEKIDSETIIGLSGISVEKNIFRISKKEITNKLKENLYINDVNIKRILPSTIELEISERKIAYQVKVINSYIYLDYQGYILEKASKAKNVPQIEGLETNQDTLLNGKRLSDNDIEVLKTVLKIKETATSVEVWKKISKITINNNQYILEFKKDKKTAYIGDATELTNRMTFLKVILEKEEGNSGKIFIDGDFSNGFKPYFRDEKKK